MKNTIVNIFLAVSSALALCIVFAECDDILLFIIGKAAAFGWLWLAAQISKRTAPKLWSDPQDDNI